MVRRNKGFLNLNRFKPGKAVKQQIKRITVNSMINAKTRKVER